MCVAVTRLRKLLQASVFIRKQHAENTSVTSRVVKGSSVYW